MQDLVKYTNARPCEVCGCFPVVRQRLLYGYVKCPICMNKLKKGLFEYNDIFLPKDAKRDELVNAWGYQQDNLSRLLSSNGYTRNERK